MVALTFYGGVNEIGGNKILLEDKGARIFLDFGQSFTLLDDYFLEEAYLSPRDRFGLRDYFALGLMPKLKGLYNKDSIGRTDLGFSKPEFDGVFISHAHADHVAHLGYLHPEIPIYLGECTKMILDSVQVTAKSGDYFSDENRVEPFRTGKQLKVGPLTVHPVHVDHSVPGAYGYIVETSEGAVAYTGDIRRHGPRADMTQEFVEKAASFDPVALIIEGTRVQPEEKRAHFTEEMVYNESLKAALWTKGLVMAMRYPRDLDRFRTFYEIARKAGRELVISTKTAHLLTALKCDPKLGLPDPLKDSRIKIYNRQLDRPGKWEAPFLAESVTSDYVHKNQKKIILELDFYHLAELVDIKPEHGCCIHSMSEPFEEDPVSSMGDGVLTNWMTLFGMPRHQFHASGHASRSEIFAMVGEIGAKKVFPVHTMCPELFKGAEKIEKGKKIML